MAEKAPVALGFKDLFTSGDTAMSLRNLCRTAGSPSATPGAFLAVGLVAGMALASGGGAAQASCRFLMPIGGSGQPVVEKRIGPDRLVGRTNWNTDFAVDRSFAS